MKKVVLFLIVLVAMTVSFTGVSVIAGDVPEWLLGLNATSYELRDWKDTDLCFMYIEKYVKKARSLLEIESEDRVVFVSFRENSNDDLGENVVTTVWVSVLFEGKVHTVVGIESGDIEKDFSSLGAMWRIMKHLGVSKYVVSTFDTDYVHRLLAIDHLRLAKAHLHFNKILSDYRITTNWFLFDVPRRHLED